MIQFVHRVESEQERALRRGKLGMALFFASLSMLFGGFLVGLFVLRSREDVWRKEGMRGLPWELWVSTSLLAVGSYFLWRAQRAALAEDREALLRAVLRAAVCLIGFLFAQASGWLDMTLSGLPLRTPNLYSFSFYALTGLHALHVLGGFPALYFVLRGALARRYGAAHHAGLTYCAMYWHYLGGVWLVLLASLHVLATR